MALVKNDMESFLSYMEETIASRKNLHPLHKYVALTDISLNSFVAVTCLPSV